MSKPQDSAGFLKNFREFIQYIIKGAGEASKPEEKHDQNRPISGRTGASLLLAKVSCEGRTWRGILVKKPEKKEI